MTALDERPVVQTSWANKYRAWWQTAPCPPWCRNDHEDKDKPEHRVCESLFIGPRQSLQEPTYARTDRGVPVYDAPMVPMMLVKGWRETEPAISIGVDIDGDQIYRVTLDEAEELRDKLNALIKLGREAAR